MKYDVLVWVAQGYNSLTVFLQGCSKCNVINFTPFQLRIFYDLFRDSRENPRGAER